MEITAREKIFLSVGAVFIILIISFWGLKSLREQVFNIDVKIDELRQEQKDIEEYGEEYEKLQSLKSGAPENIDKMLPDIDRILLSLNLKATSSISTSDSIVEKRYIKRQANISFRDSLAEPVMQFIKQIESDPSSMYTVENFSARKLTRKPGYYYFTIKVIGYSKK
ncbi:MAG: hypothetical protein OEZ13_09540 [Spirochaetia bacterium]|nr:hypothetical protein [Spirochaetia bacterium]